MKKPHYAWAVCAAGTLLVFCTMGLSSNAFSACLPYIRNTYELTGSQGSSIMSVRSMFSVVGMLFVSKYYKVLGLRVGTGIACAIAALSYLSYSMSRTLPMFYVSAAIGGIAFGIGSMIPVSLLMTRWFVSRRALALGICAAGSGICTIFFPPLMVGLVQSLGLTKAFLIESAFVAVCCVFILLVVRDEPSKLGMEPYSEGEADKAKAKIFGERNMKKGEWAFMAVALFLVGGISTAMPAHFAELITSSGYSSALSAACVSVFGITLTAGKFIYGAVTDKIGAKRSTFLFYLLLVPACLCTLGANGGTPVFCYIMVALFGLGFPPSTVGVSVWSADFSTAERYAVTLKWFQILYACGGMVITLLPGLMFDRFGNYQSAYLLFIAFLAVIMTALMVMYKRIRKVK